jgi:hypothetical protein
VGDRHWRELGKRSQRDPIQTGSGQRFEPLADLANQALVISVHAHRIRKESHRSTVLRNPRVFAQDGGGASGLPDPEIAAGVISDCS